MKTLFAIILLASAGCFSALAETFTLNVGEFTRLKVVDGINVDYHQCQSDSAGLVIFECNDKALASTIGMAKNKDQLTLSYTTVNERPTGLPTVRVYSSFLTSVENSGDSLVRVMRVSSCPEFKVKQIGNGRIVVRDIKATKVSAALATGNGTVVLYGTCNEAALNMTGTGVIQADALKANTVSIRTFGTGQIGCNPSAELKIRGLGSTSVYYKGAPEIRNQAVGVKLEHID
nr:hypothetical protein [Bacteroides sp.]